MAKTHLIAVGACAIDTILTVPHYPEEDSKLRALSLTKRRGGNCPNSLEVLLQLVNKYGATPSDDNNPIDSDRDSQTPPKLKLSLIATLPARSSTQIPFITASLSATTGLPNEDSTPNRQAILNVDLSRCIYRENHQEPVSSYIISSQTTSSRTVVNHNELREMTFDEFVNTTQDILNPTSHIREVADNVWFHFEGRIPETTLQCIKYLRNHHASNNSTNKVKLSISVELEKPFREGLQELAFEADVVFYSRSWAEAEGYRSIEDCLRAQAELLGSHASSLQLQRTLICTWGNEGAGALSLPSRGSASSSSTQSPCATAPSATTATAATTTQEKIILSQAYISPANPILDTVGAGDTFIAGMLFGFTCRSHTNDHNSEATEIETKISSRRQQVWSLSQKLDFANGLAGRKILQDGFRGLAGRVEGLLGRLDSI